MLCFTDLSFDCFLPLKMKHFSAYLFVEYD